MSRDKIKPAAIENFKTRLSRLPESGEIDDAVFADIVYAAVSGFGIDEELFRDTFGLSRDAVSRWTQRQNLPQPAVRRKIIMWISAQL